MSIVLNDNIKLNAGKPLDSKYLNGIIDYATVSEVNSIIPKSERYLGLTVRIIGVEYWYSIGVEDIDLVEKTSSGTTGVTNGLSVGATNGLIGLGGELTEDTIILGNNKGLNLGGYTNKLGYSEIIGGNGIWLVNTAEPIPGFNQYVDIRSYSNDPTKTKSYVYRTAGHPTADSVFGIDVIAHDGGLIDFAFSKDNGSVNRMELDGSITNKYGIELRRDSTDDLFVTRFAITNDDTGLEVEDSRGNIGLNYKNRIVDELNIDWAIDDNHIPSIGLIRTNLEGIQVVDNVIFVSKSRGGAGIPYRYDEPFINIQLAIDAALPGDKIQIIDGIFDESDRFILKTDTVIEFLDGTKWNIIGEDNVLAKEEGRICKNTTDVKCTIIGFLDINLSGQKATGPVGGFFPRLFALTGNSIINIQIRDVYASAEITNPVSAGKVGTLVDCGDSVQCNLVLRDVNGQMHPKFNVTNFRDNSTGFCVARNVNTYRYISTRNDATANYVAINCIGTGVFVENTSKASLKCDSIDIAGNDNFLISGTIKSLSIECNWIFLPLNNTFSESPTSIQGFCEIKHANIVGFEHNVLGQISAFNTFNWINYNDNSFILDTVKIITPNSTKDILAANTKKINCNGVIANRDFADGTLIAGNATVNSEYTYPFATASEDFPNFHKIMWSWSDAKCVISGGVNNGNYRRKTITSNRYDINTLNNTGYTPIIKNITDSFILIDELGTEIFNYVTITDIEFQELTDTDYMSRLHDFYWYIKQSYDERFTMFINSGVQRYPNVSLLRTSDSNGIADIASGVSCPI